MVGCGSREGGRGAGVGAGAAAAMGMGMGMEMGYFQGEFMLPAGCYVGHSWTKPLDEAPDEAAAQTAVDS